jgi:hypothetical protein
MKFQVCLQELSKTSGLFDTIKDVALTEVANTKPWIIGRKKPLTAGLKETGKLIAGARPAAQSGVRTAVRSAGSGARVYDVSEQARKMGIT